MHALSDKEVARVRRFLEETAVPCDLTTFGSILLPAAQSLVPSLVTCYAQFDPASGNLVAQEMYPSIAPSKDAGEFVGLMREHPVFEEWARTGTTPTLRRSDLITSSEWHKRSLFQYVYKPWGCEDSMPVGLPAPGGLVACLCSERDSEFTDVDLNLIELVRPHIAQMYRGAETLSLLSEAVPSTGVRTMVLDNTGKLLYATQPAWDLLAAYYPGFSGRSAAFPTPVRKWVEAELNRFTHAGELPEVASPLAAARDNGDVLHLRILLGKRTGDRALLVLEERRSTGPVQIPARFGLSRREEEILKLVRLGESSAAIADQLFLSRRTVEKHLENIYCKLGVENRMAAVAVAFSSEESE